MLEADAKLIIIYLFFVRKMTGDVFAAWNDAISKWNSLNSNAEKLSKKYF